MSTIAKTRKKDKPSDAPGRADAQEYLISDLSREFDVTLRALRFYEDRGLLSPRRIGTMRLYSVQDRARLTVILKGKQLGFTLAEIQEMLDADARGGQSGIDLKLSVEKIDEQIAHLEAQRTEVETAIAELRATRDKLTG
jgi:DNA-binding transcriptional MerR regulator